MEGTTDGLNMMKIMIESSALAWISTYVAENKILATLKAESQQILTVKLFTEIDGPMVSDIALLEVGTYDLTFGL